MSYSSRSRSSSRSRNSIDGSSQNASPRSPGEHDAKDEIVEIQSNSTALTRSVPQQLVTQTTPVLSAEELDRMNRWVTLQERLAKVNRMARPGHTYGKLTTTGNARAIRGNLYEDSSSLPFLRNHSYDESDAKDDSLIWEGDISVAAFTKFSRQCSSRGSS